MQAKPAKPHKLICQRSELLSSPKIWRSEEADEKAASEPPSYVFDASVLRRRRDLVKKASALTTSFMERHCSHVRVPQFGVGFRGAGAPMHTHHAALNASFAGFAFRFGSSDFL